MGCDAGQERRRDVASEPQVPGWAPLLDHPSQQTQRRNKVARDRAEVREQQVRKLFPMQGQRPQQSPPRLTILAQLRRRTVQVAPGDAGAGAIEWMCVRRLRLQHLDSVSRQIEGPEERRRHRHRVDSRADVVLEPR